MAWRRQQEQAVPQPKFEARSGCSRVPAGESVRTRSLLEGRTREREVRQQGDQPRDRDPR